MVLQDITYQTIGNIHSFTRFASVQLGESAEILYILSVTVNWKSWKQMDKKNLNSRSTYLTLHCIVFNFGVGPSSFVYWLLANDSDLFSSRCSDQFWSDSQLLCVSGVSCPGTRTHAQLHQSVSEDSRTKIKEAYTSNTRGRLKNRDRGCDLAPRYDHLLSRDPSVCAISMTTEKTPLMKTWRCSRKLQ